MEEGEDQGVAWYVFVILLNWTLIKKNNKREQPKQLHQVQNTQQKITTHNTHVGKSYLSIVLNQRQQ